MFGGATPTLTDASVAAGGNAVRVQGVSFTVDQPEQFMGQARDEAVKNARARAEVLAALEAVDLVVIFEQDTPLELIRRVEPSVLVKGGDWKPEAMVGSTEVRGWGGSVHSIPFLVDTSTTRTLPLRSTHRVPRSARRSSAFLVVPQTSAASASVSVSRYTRVMSSLSRSGSPANR